MAQVRAHPVAAQVVAPETDLVQAPVTVAQARAYPVAAQVGSGDGAGSGAVTVAQVRAHRVAAPVAAPETELVQAPVTAAQARALGLRRRLWLRRRSWFRRR